MAQPVKVLATRPDDQLWILMTHMVEAEKFKDVLKPVF